MTKRKRFLREPADTFTGPEGSDKVQPIFTAVGSGWAAEQSVYFRKALVKQRDETVLQHCPPLDVLLILPVAALQQKLGIFLWEVLR